MAAAGAVITPAEEALDNLFSVERTRDEAVVAVTSALPDDDAITAARFNGLCDHVLALVDCLGNDEEHYARFADVASYIFASPAGTTLALVQGILVEIMGKLKAVRSNAVLAGHLLHVLHVLAYAENSEVVKALASMENLTIFRLLFLSHHTAREIVFPAACLIKLLEPYRNQRMGYPAGAIISALSHFADDREIVVVLLISLEEFFRGGNLSTGGGGGPSLGDLIGLLNETCYQLITKHYRGDLAVTEAACALIGRCAQSGSLLRNARFFTEKMTPIITRFIAHPKIIEGLLSGCGSLLSNRESAVVASMNPSFITAVYHAGFLNMPSLEVTMNTLICIWNTMKNSMSMQWVRELPGLMEYAIACLCRENGDADSSISAYANDVLREWCDPNLNGDEAHAIRNGMLVYLIRVLQDMESCRATLIAVTLIDRVFLTCEDEDLRTEAPNLRPLLLRELKHWMAEGLEFATFSCIHCMGIILERHQMMRKKFTFSPEIRPPVEEAMKKYAKNSQLVFRCKALLGLPIPRNAFDGIPEMISNDEVVLSTRALKRAAEFTSKKAQKHVDLLLSIAEEPRLQGTMTPLGDICDGLACATRAHPDNETIICNIFTIIQTVSDNRPEAGRLIRKHHLIYAVCKSYLQQSHSVHTTARACSKALHTILNMTKPWDDDLRAHVILRTPIPAAITHAALQHPTDVEAQTYVCQLLGRIAMASTHQEHTVLQRAGFEAAIATLISTYTKNHQAEYAGRIVNGCFLAFGVMYCMSDMNGQNASACDRSRLLALDLITLMCDAMRQFINQADTVTRGLASLFSTLNFLPEDVRAEQIARSRIAELPPLIKAKLGRNMDPALRMTMPAIEALIAGNNAPPANIPYLRRETTANMSVEEVARAVEAYREQYGEDATLFVEDADKDPTVLAEERARAQGGGAGGGAGGGGGGGGKKKKKGGKK